MVVVIMFCLLSIMMMAIYKNSKQFFPFIVTAIVLASLYFFFTPSSDYDLFRHYEVLNIIEKMSFKELFIGGSNPTGNWLLADYLSSSKGYLLYSFIISKLGIDELLPVITVFIIYYFLFKRIYQVGIEQKASPIVIFFAFITILFVMDYRDLSSIRYILAYSLFTYIAYEDLVNKKNTIICFVIYVLLCFLHMSCVVLLAIRVAALLATKSKVLRIIAMVVLAGAYTFVLDILPFVTKIISNPYLDSLVYKIMVYRVARTDYNWSGAVVFLLIIGMLSIIFFRTFNKKMSKELQGYASYTCFVWAFAIGSFSQYDMLRRNVPLFMMTVLPFVIIYFEKQLKGTPLNFSVLSAKQYTFDYIITIGYIPFLMCCLAFFWWISYLPMDHLFFI